MSTSPASLSSIFSNPSQLSLLGLSAGAGAVPTPASGSSSSTSSVSPVISATNQALLNQLGDQYQHLTNTGVNLQPYQQQQEQQINTNSDLAQKAAQEQLAARGLSASSVAGTVAAQGTQNRVAQIGQLQQQIPLLQHEQTLQNLGAESGFAASIPHGTTSSTNTNFQTQTGGGIGGFLGGLGKALGGIIGLGSTPSDKRLKDNVHDTTDGLDKILQLKPKEFNYKEELDPSGEVHSGFMAQDLEKLFPSVVSTEPHSGMKLVKYHELIPKIVSAIQELHDKMGSMSKENKTAEVA